ncbi:MAG: serine/threonine-protein kinase [Planctomycetota bacterium]
MADLCPTFDVIARYASGEQLEEVGEHVERCTRCRETSVRLREDNEFLAAVLQDLNKARPGVPPARAEFPGYEVLGEIRRGGQGIVYRAVQKATKREVAIKVLIEGLSRADGRRRRFERELKIISQLRHPHIVTVHDGGVTDSGQAFLVMEYVDGASLDEYLRDEGNKLGLEGILRLMITIAEAIGHAHHKGIIHRDIKPSNIVIDATGSPRVLDFGLAKSTSDDPSIDDLTDPGEFLGTLAYASPEQLSEDRHLADVRSDVYSLGVILYVALTGIMPYGPARSVRDLVDGITNVVPCPPSGRLRVPPRPVGFHRGYRADLDAIVACALEKSPERRYQSVGDFVEDLRNLLTGDLVQARRHHRGYVLRKTVARHRVAVSISLLVVVLLAASAVVSLSFWFRAEREKAVAEVEATRFRETTRFLSRLFESIDPERARGRTVSVREVLDSAATTLSNAPPSSADVEYAVRFLIGRTFVQLGFPDLAEPHLERALTLQDGVPGAAERLELIALLARCHEDLQAWDRAASLWERFEREGGSAFRAIRGRAGVLHGQGRYEEALALYRLARKREPPAPRDLAELLRDEGVALQQLGHSDEALRILEECLALVSGLGLEGTVIHADVTRTIGHVWLELGDIVRGVRALDAGFSMARTLFGDDHVETIVAASAVAVACLEQGRESSEEVALVLSRSEATLAASDIPRAAHALANLGEIAWARSDFSRAESLFSRARDLWQARGGRYAIEVAHAESRRALAIFSMGRHQEGHDLARRATEKLEGVLGLEHPGLLDSLDVVGTCASVREEHAEAEAIFRRMLKIARASFDQESPRVARALARQGAELSALGRLEEAADALREAVPSLEATLGYDHDHTLYAKQDLGRLMARSGDPGAVELLEEVVEIRRELENNEVGLTHALADLGFALRCEGRDEEALEVFREVVARRRANPADPGSLVLAMNNLAALELATGNRAEARHLLEEAVSLAKDHLDAASVSRLGASRNLAALLEQDGEWDRAAELREEIYVCLRAELGDEDVRVREAKASWEAVKR